MLARTLPEKKACRYCGKSFAPARPMQQVCGMRCAKAELRQAKKAKVTQTRARKEAIKTKPDLIKEAQHAFNAYIRERDRLAGYACISSGRPLDWSGNGTDAGHYRSTGSAPHLRFNEDNCHAQSKHDNQYKSGAAVDYRIGLVKRIGLERVEALEADQSSPKWTHDDLRAIKQLYKEKLKKLLT